mgnify:CR=1 FL=1
MAVMEAEKQLSLEVGGEEEAPSAATFKIGGALADRRRELPKGADVLVTVTALDGGEVIVRGRGFVRSVSFIDHHEEGGRVWVERAHSIKLGERG